jgi:hypothetical protein
MKGFENQTYAVLLLLSNVVAIILLLVSIFWPRVARFAFFILFAWASIINWKTVLEGPQRYLEYAELAFSETYREFIKGWFAQHIKLMVGLIASAQALIAVGILLRGVIFKVAAIGAILFLLAIVPLGVGAGFPCTIIMAITLWILLKKYQNTFAWQ